MKRSGTLRRTLRLTEHRLTGRLFTPASAVCLLAYANVLVAQPPRTSNLGISGVGAVGFHVGYDALERSSEGLEAGATLDLGWLRSPSLRLQAEVAFMRATLTETVVVEDKTYHDFFFDLSGSLSLVWLAGTSRATPYVLAGVAVHALSSAFGTRVLDERYNANPFGAHAGAGLSLRPFSSRRHAVIVEVRRVVAENVNRTSARFGGMLFFNDLIR